MNETEVLIIGAGPAGLSISALLGKNNIPYILLEKEEQIGAAWRTHYERLHLHTVKRYSHLPMLEFPSDYPRYVPRDKLVSYFESYVAKFGIKAITNEEVISAEYENDIWKIGTKKSQYKAKRVVVCAGYNHTPKLPKWDGQEKFKGEVIHSKQYRNADSFKGKKVLIVGAGNTGGELAIDLWEKGAFPSISVRSKLHIVPREIFGIPMQISSLILSKFPLPIADFFSKLVIGLVAEDMSKFGITKPNISPYRQVIEQEKIPLIDIGTSALIKQEQVKIFPDIKCFKENSIVFANDKEESFDSVILCTGFHTGLRNIFTKNTNLFNDKGYPKEKAVEIENGLYFLGYNNHITGFLRYINVESQKIAKDILKKMRG